MLHQRWYKMTLVDLTLKLLGRKYAGPEVDIWSLGVTLFSMITGLLPFENITDIINGHFKNPQNISES